MTKQQIEKLRREVEEMAAGGAGRGEFREWSEAYYFGIEDLYEVVKLMVDEPERHRLCEDEAKSLRTQPWRTRSGDKATAGPLPLPL
jgi:hypothetical protein